MIAISCNSLCIEIDHLVSVCFVEDELLARIITRNRHGKSEAQQQPQQSKQPALERTHLPCRRLMSGLLKCRRPTRKPTSDAASSNAERTIKTCHCVAKIAENAPSNIKRERVRWGRGTCSDAFRAPIPESWRNSKFERISLCWIS